MTTLQDPQQTDTGTPITLYPIGSTAYSASLVTRVTITGVKHTTRQVEWQRGDDPRPFTNSLNINELSDSDDPATIATLAKTGETKDPWKNTRDALAAKVKPDWEVGDQALLGHTLITLQEISATQGGGYRARFTRDGVPQPAGYEEWCDLSELATLASQLDTSAQPPADTDSEGGYIKPGSGFISGLRSSSDAMIDTPEHPAGHECANCGTRYYLTEGARCPNCNFSRANFGELVTPPTDPATLDQAGESTIAENEFTIAQTLAAVGDKLRQRDNTIMGLNDQLSEKETEVEGLERMIATLQQKLDVQADATMKALQQRDAYLDDNESLKRSYRSISARIAEMEAQANDDPDEESGYLEHLIMESNAELNARIKALEAAQVAQTQPRTIETMKLVDPDMDEIAGYRNQGWHVVFEDLIVLPEYGKEFTHFLRLEREISTPTTPPHDDARAVVTVPRVREIDTPAPVEDTPSDETEGMRPQPAEIVFLTADAPQDRTPIDPRDIDPKMPAAEILRRYGAETLTRFWNQQIVDDMATTALRWDERVGRLISHPVSPFPVLAVSAAQ
jgi:hypothetical protein